VAVIVHYLTNSVGIKTVTIDHVFSCFRVLHRKVGDLRRAVTRAKEEGYIAYSSADDLKMTVAGDDYVLHRLPKPRTHRP